MSLFAIGSLLRVGSGRKMFSKLIQKAFKLIAVTETLNNRHFSFSDRLLPATDPCATPYRINLLVFSPAPVCFVFADVVFVVSHSHVNKFKVQINKIVEKAI